MIEKRNYVTSLRTPCDRGDSDDNPLDIAVKQASSVFSSERAFEKDASMKDELSDAEFFRDERKSGSHE